MNTDQDNHVLAVSSFLLVLGAVLLVALSIQSTVATRVPVTLSVLDQGGLEESAALAVPELPWQEIEIKPGDNLTLIFMRAGLSVSELHKILESGGDARLLKKIVPGKKIGYQVSDSGELEQLRYLESPLQSLIVQRLNGEFKTNLEVKVPDVITSYQVARITDEEPSLYDAGKKAGLSSAMIMKLSDIFQWDISFALDLRRGDSFAVIYEGMYVDGAWVKDGNILGAYFRNMGKQHVALLYEQDGVPNYFSPEGRSLRKAFIRDPVHFSHVSSGFNMRRLHPIHNKVTPHRGIDYAAKKGTPVLASGSGKVTIARQNSASGKYVVIQHGEQYTTKYLHLSNFAKNMKVGTTVKQGDVIGYVGATGWATAPHLHYEFLVDGVHRNPRTVALPKAESIPAKDFGVFKEDTSPMLARLTALAGPTTLALADESELTQSAED